MLNFAIAVGLALTQTAPPAPRTKAWVPPPTKLPVEFVQAVEFLHHHGMADPRGGELRRAKIVKGNLWGGSQPVEVYGWVMPATSGEARQLVTLQGLAFPVVSIGEPAKLDDAVATAALPPFRLSTGPDQNHALLLAAQLLVLGEAERAHS